MCGDDEKESAGGDISGAGNGETVVSQVFASL
jgi:hypothetical protein